METAYLPVSLLSLRDRRAAEASSMAVKFSATSEHNLLHPINWFSAILHSKPF